MTGVAQDRPQRYVLQVDKQNDPTSVTRDTSAEKRLDYAALIEGVRKRTEDVRANLQDIAKWLIVGFGGIISFIVGGSGLAKLGSMPVDWRMFLAVAALVGLGVAASWPLWHGIQVLRRKIYGWDEIVRLQDLEKARHLTEVKYLSQIPGLGGFQNINDELAARKKEHKAKRSDATRNKLEVIQYRASQAAELCKITDIELRYDQFLKTLWSAGGITLLCCCGFVYLVNAPDNSASEKKRTSLRTTEIAWSAANESVLEKAGMRAECMRDKHPTLIMIADLPGGEAVVLAVPPNLSETCRAVRAILTEQRTLAAE